MQSKEEIEDLHERRKTAAYGPADVRLAKTKAYVAHLVEAHSEEWIRRLLKAMLNSQRTSKKRSSERRIDTAPLEQIFRPFDIPWFYFEAIEIRDGMVQVDMTHGIYMAARGERFLFEIQGQDFQLVDWQLIWMS